MVKYRCQELGRNDRHGPLEGETRISDDETYRTNERTGAAGYILLWLLGIPLPILFCHFLTTWLQLAGKTYGNNSPDHPHPPSNRCLSLLAPQQSMGLLPFRRYRTDPVDHTNPGPFGEDLAAPQPKARISFSSREIPEKLPRVRVTLPLTQYLVLLPPPGSVAPETDRQSIEQLHAEVTKECARLVRRANFVTE